MWTWPRLVAVLCVGTLAETVRLTCRLGELEGSQRTSPRTGRPYFAFTSIPYAQPPIGTLRLRNPVESGGWTGVLDATKPAPPCLQTVSFIPILRNQPIGQEDCLYLNVYTPTLDSSKKLPVLVYVHGGGFKCGQPVPSQEASTNFMEEDVVLVTIHYRLGIFGFLSTEDSEIPGNFGLKDQAMAIKWTSENIDAFGGDPSTITVFGESAGGASAHYLILSPLSRDLLKGAIAQSGMVNDAWAVSPPGKERRNARKLSEIVGCELNNDFLSCLQELDGGHILAAESKFVVWDFDPGVVFQPVIEANVDGAFLIEDPLKIVSNKPLITGMVTAEGSLKSLSLAYQEDSVLDEFINNYEKIIGPAMFVDPVAPKQSQFFAVLKERYFKDFTNQYVVVKGLEKLYGDRFFTYPMHKGLQRHRGPKYGYIIDHKAEKTAFEIYGGPILDRKYSIDRPGHTDELLSLFNWTSITPNPKVTDEDVEFSIRLVKLWTNFAKYQNPTPEGSQVVWEPYENGNVFHIRTHDDSMVHWPYDEVVEFWEKAIQIIKPQDAFKDEL